MTPRDNLHRLVDEIADSDVSALERIAAALVMTARKISWEELSRVLDNAPLDDEEETPEEAAAVAEAREDIAAGRVYTWEETWKKLGNG